MKDNNKGFTLIELLAVVLIMVFILMVAVPSVARLIKENNSRRYGIYHDLIAEAALAYSSTKSDELGGFEGKGCIELDLDDLIKSGYVKKFEDAEISCDTPTSSSKDKIRIFNNKGEKHVNVSLICEKNGKVVYSELIDKQGTCVPYAAPVKNVLVTKLKEVLDSTASLTATDSNGDRFVIGNTDRNYVYYSGKLWRVVSINETTKTVKLITDEVISTVFYGGNKGIVNSDKDYLNSDIYTWLNSDFLPSLKDKDTYLEAVNWDYTRVASITPALPVSPVTQKSQVGLLSPYEYARVMNGTSSSFLNKDRYWWLLSSKDDANAWYINSSNVASSSAKTNFYGVRPVITLKANMIFVGTSSGTASLPYKLMGDDPVPNGTYVNTRYSGEYVTFNGAPYRIVEVNKDYTKIVSDTIINSSQMFDDAYCQLSPELIIGNYLNSTIYGSLTPDSKELLTFWDWCVESVSPVEGIQGGRCTNIRYLTRANDFKVGLLKAGEMYASSLNFEYWTMSPVETNNCLSHQNKKMNVVTTDGRIVQKTYEDELGVRPAYYLNKDVKISSGTGMSSSRFVLFKG